jgi:hypothetical protein
VCVVGFVEIQMYVDKPSHVRIRVSDSYCKGLTNFFNIN